MNIIAKLILATCLLTSVVSCGLKEAVDATKDMPEKMDETNGKIDLTNQQMAETQEAIRLQKLGIAKQNLEDPANAVTMQPIPTGMMGYAKLFAETANADELVGQIYLYMTEINRGLYPVQVDANNQPLPADVDAGNTYKTQRFIAAQAISAFIPSDVLEEIVQTEIINEGRYKEAALNLLMLRFSFTSQVLLDKSLLDDELTSVGMVEKSLEYIENLETIAKYAFVDQVKFKVYGFAGQPPIEADLKDAGAQILSRLESIDLQISFNLDGADLGPFSSNPKENAKIQKEAQKRLTSAMSTVQEKILFWQNNTP